MNWFFRVSDHEDEVLMAIGGAGDGTGWSRTPLGLLKGYRITEIPRPRESGHREDSDPGRPRRVAALVAAYHAGIAESAGPASTVAFGWVRTATGAPVQVVAAGDALAGS